MFRNAVLAGVVRVKSIAERAEFDPSMATSIVLGPFAPFVLLLLGMVMDATARPRARSHVSYALKNSW